VEKLARCFARATSSRRDFEIPEFAEVVEGAEADPAVGEGFVLRGEDGFFHVVEINRDAAAGGVVDEFEAVPPIGLPGGARGAGGGDGFAIGVIHEVNLVMHAIGLLAEVGVVETRVVLAREGEAEIVVARVEFRELRLDRQCEGFPLGGLEPCEIEGAANGGLEGLLAVQREHGAAGVFGPSPRAGIGEGHASVVSSGRTGSAASNAEAERRRAARSFIAEGEGEFISARSRTAGRRFRAGRRGSRVRCRGGRR
jgi:hypothetical protein